MTKRGVLLVVLAGLACFGLGVGLSRWGGPGPRRPPNEPQILIDGRSVNLLPDASLRLDLPRGFEPDAGAR